MDETGVGVWMFGMVGKRPTEGSLMTGTDREAMSDEKLEEVGRKICRTIEEQGGGALIAGVQNRVELHFHVDNEAVGDALAELILTGAHNLTISIKGAR